MPVPHPPPPSESRGVSDGQCTLLRFSLRSPCPKGRSRASTILLWRGVGASRPKTLIEGGGHSLGGGGGGLAWDGRRGCRCFEARQWLDWVVVVVQPALFASAMNSETSQT